MSTLRATIDALAAEFAHELLRELRAASLDEIIAETMTHHTKVKRTPSAPFVATSRQSRRRSGRVRRSPEELQAVVDRLVATVAMHPAGIRAEDLKRAMGLPSGNRGAKVFTGPLAMALHAKTIRKKGQRRATTYFKA